MRKTISPSKYGSATNTPNRIVVHSMAEYIKDDVQYYATEWLNKLGLSAHALVTPDGIVIRTREDSQGAWHAKGFNLNSLGIEFLVKGVHNYQSFTDTIKTDWVTPEQYSAGLEQIKEWIGLHSIQKIERHSDLSPGRKVDPGQGFPWEQLLSEIFFNDVEGIYNG